MKAIDLSEVIKNYKNKWVALTFDNKKFIGSGESLNQVLKKAEKKGVKDPSIFKVPNTDNLFVG